MNIGNYQLIERIGATAGGELYIARHLHDGTAVMLKLFDRDGADVADGMRLRNEYALLQLLHVPEIIRPIALHDEGKYLALVLEPFAGECLDTVLARQPHLPLPVALTMALQAARALAALHAAGIVHRDLRPANFLLAHAHDDVRLKLADLSRATAREGADSDRTAAGRDWAYISPEQTGRMNRQADHRTDFYSLGIMLYRLLTGRLPFQADDPLEWVHCHLARVPVPPHELAPDLPPAVSGLVLKLLAKVPEERYQSVGGLLADLEQCLTQWQESGEIAPFALGMRDMSDRFQIPPKLYGREQEKAALLAAFETAATTGTPMLMTVAGYSGVGKSALVHALQQPIAERHGYFIAGKFDQYQRDIPYATLAQAFNGLVRQFLGESEAAIGEWRQRLREALEPNAQLMASLIPRLELVIGPQPPVPELPPQQAQGRFQLVFRRFLGVFATQEHPLVLFLDDLQWVDAGTLALLADLATHPDVRYLLLVGAYRDNEVDANHPLMHGLDAIHQKGGAVQEIALVPLTLGEVAQLAAEALHCPPDEARPLAQLVWDKTGGNPFFTRQFLATLAEEKLLQFDAGCGAWRWNLPRIQAKGFTDNIADLMVGKLARLPPETQEALARFACLGNTADAATLGIVLERSVEAVHALLREAERVGLVCRQEDTYTFLHDRVQEASYSLLPEAARAAMHLRIGRLLASNLRPEAVAERVFEVVSQLNRGSELVESQAERERIAELNLMAGQRAKEATAYAAALTYLAAAAALLPPDCWERRYPLSFAIELARAECEFLTGGLASAEARLAGLVPRAADLVDLAAVTCLQGQIFTTLDQPDRSIEVALDYLRRVGIVWPAHPAKEEVRREYDCLLQRIGDRPIEAFLDLPPMAGRIAVTMNVLNEAYAPAYFTDQNLYCLIAFRMANLSLEHGNCEASCYAYEVLAVVLGAFYGDYQSAFRFGKLAIDLVDRNQVTSFTAARVHMVFGGCVNSWRRHGHTSIDFLRRGIDLAQRGGDSTYAAYGHLETVVTRLTSGVPLAEVQHEAEAALDFTRRARFGLMTYNNTGLLRLILTLRGLTPAFGAFAGPDFDEREYMRQLEEDPHLSYAACRHWVRTLQARYFADDHAGALAAAAKAHDLLWMVQPFFDFVEYRYFTALAHAALWNTASAAERPSHLQAVAASHEQLQQWAASCPENFANRAALVGAELARLEGREFDALCLYEQAIDSARDNGFVHNEAIACECSARFYLARGLARPGNACLDQARACYARWGADGKVRQLDERYPQLRTHTERAAAKIVDGEVQLDMLSVTKASQAISGRIVLDEVIDTLMRIMLENAGAQSGCLLLSRHEELLLAADANVEQQTLQVRQHPGPTPLDIALPAAILNYVRRSREPVLLMDAAAPHPFSADPYFAQRHPKSVLCLPILRQSALIGVLYLEHNLATHAFPPDRVKVLELLASQAAISLENAQLYTDVREREARVRQLVESNIIGIFFFDMQGGMIDANDALLHMLGYSRDDLLSGTLQRASLTPGIYRSLNEQKMAEVRATGKCTPYEKEYIRKDGSLVPVLIGAALFEGSQEHGVAFVLDLTERRQAEAERTARKSAEAANAAKSAFLANMSHELRTPLNGILGYAQILQHDKTLGERQLAGVNVIRQSGDHLLTLINDILDLAKIEAGKMELYLADLQLATFARTIVEMVGVKAAQKGLAFICDIAPDVPQWIRADEKRLRQVLLNLLSNAVKFTDHGQVALRVRAVSPSRLRFEVQDTGVGIDAAQLDAIFQPFEQVGEAQRRLGGTGLGLTISRQYVRLMGGDIQVESRPGQGSTFWFELEVPVMMVEAATAPARTVTGYAGPRNKVLVVDDVAENRTVVADLLTPLGFEVGEAANGREGLEMAQRLRPHLILTDIVMPEMDGLEATRRLRELPAFKDVPIIALSANVSVADSAKCLAAGMNAFLPKPIDVDRLLGQIGTVLQLDWVYDQPEAEVSSEVDASEEALVLPPQPEMEVLYRLARRGNMQDILAHTAYLVELDPRYGAFASQLGLLAKSYQSKAILSLVERCLNGSQMQ